MDEKDIISGLTEEEQERLRKIEKLDSNQKRKKLIFAGVTVVLILLFVFGTFFGGKYILSYEGSEELPAPGYAPLDFSSASVPAEINTLVSQSKNYAGMKLDIRHGVSIPDDSITAESGDINAAEMLKFVKGSVEGKLNEIYSASDYSGSYGEDFSAKLHPLGFTEADVKSAEMTVNEENDSELTATVTFDGCPADALAASPVCAFFGLEDVESAVNAAESAFASDFTIKDRTLTYGDFVLDAVISRKLVDGNEERTLNRLVYTRSCNVELTVDFIGELAAYGTQKIGFTVNCSEEFGFSRVSFDISKDVYFIEKGDSDEINHKVNSDESVQDIKITWESSDPTILTVDAKGFYKGRKISDKPVTVTGTYVYNGVTYTDESIFYIRKPVDNVKLSEKELEMKVGEEAKLEAIIKPADSTLKDVYWFTTDSAVVTVDNGTVKAVAPGEASVYVITFDGNFKKSCPVTVTEEGTNG